MTRASPLCAVARDSSARPSPNTSEPPITTQRAPRRLLNRSAASEPTTTSSANGISRRPTPSEDSPRTDWRYIGVTNSAAVSENAPTVIVA